MKVLLIVLAVIVGLPVYAFIGFQVFVATAKICDYIEYGDWRSERWRGYWSEDVGTPVMFMVFWPVLVAMGAVVLPFYGVYMLIKKMIERGE